MTDIIEVGLSGSLILYLPVFSNQEREEDHVLNDLSIDREAYLLAKSGVKDE